MIKKYSDIFSGAIFFTLSIGLYIMALDIKVSIFSKYGGTIMPKAIAVIMFFLSLILLAGGIIKAVSEKTKKSDKEKKALRISALPFLLVSCTLVAYVFLLKTIGYIFMTALAMFILMFILSGYARKKVLRFILISVVFSSLVYYIFVNFLNLLLPPGILG